MPNPFQSKGYLGELGKRLQRFFQFDGEAYASHTSEAVPVLIIGDASQPGYGDDQQRRFMMYAELAAAEGLQITPTIDLIIDYVRVDRISQGLANLDVTAVYYPRLIAPQPSIGGITARLFLDRVVSGLDTPPAAAVRVNSTVITAGAIPLNRVFMDFSAGAHRYDGVLIEKPFCLAVGNSIMWGIPGASTDGCAITVYGRTM